LRARVVEFALRQHIETGLTEGQISALLGKEAAQALLQQIRAAEEAAEKEAAEKEAAEKAALEAENESTEEGEDNESTEEGELALPSEAELAAVEIDQSLLDTSKEDEDIPPQNIVEYLLKCTVSQKIKAGMKGNKQVRSILINDSNRLVSSAVLKNPGLTDSEAIKIAASRSVSADVIRQITLNREWMRMYSIQVALVNNPKCPRGIAMRLIGSLRKHDLRALAKNKGVPGQVATAARKLYKESL
jgi:hypothetical protein